MHSMLNRQDFGVDSNDSDQGQQTAQIVSLTYGRDMTRLPFIIPFRDSTCEAKPNIGLQLDDVRRCEIMRVGSRAVKDLHGAPRCDANLDSGSWRSQLQKIKGISD